MIIILVLVVLLLTLLIVSISKLREECGFLCERLCCCCCREIHQIAN